MNLETGLTPKTGLKRGATRAALAAALLAVAGSALAADVVREPSIPFANHGGIRDWQADRDQGVWIQDTHRKWYYAKLMGPCYGLNFAERLGFDTRPEGTFDRFSAIVVPGNGRCTVQTFMQSGAPKSKKEREEAAAADAAAAAALSAEKG